MKKGFSALLLAIFISLFAPIIHIVAGWISGTIIKITFGAYITNGLNLLFNTNRFTPNLIPVICSVLSLLRMFINPPKINMDE